VKWEDNDIHTELLFSIDSGFFGFVVGDLNSVIGSGHRVGIGRTRGNRSCSNAGGWLDPFGRVGLVTAGCERDTGVRACEGLGHSEDG
jgi:hypothetical protein